MTSPSALESRDFRILLGSGLISLTGTQMQRVAVAWQIYLLTHSPVSLGLLAFFRVAPMIALALGGGVVADAVDRRRMQIFTQTLLAASSGLLAAANIFHFSSVPIIYAAALVAGGAAAFDMPARQALIPQLVSREQLPSALGLLTTCFQLSMVCGPAIAGYALARFGVTAVYVFDVASFFAVICGLLVIRHREPKRSKSDISLRAALDGIRFAWKTPILAQLMAVDFVATFFAGSLLLLPIFAAEIFHCGPTGLGWLYAAQPMGAALASLVLALRPPSQRGSNVLWAAGAYGAAIATFGLMHNFWLALFFLALSGAADAISMVIRQTVRQLLTPDELRGRMTSLNMIFFIGGPQLGEVEAGVVARFLGVRFAVVSGGLVCVAVVLGAALWAPTLRQFGGENTNISPG